MQYKISFTIIMAALGLSVLTGCTSYEPPPKAITRSSYTEIPSDEHKKMPVPSSKILTLEAAQNLAVQNNPDFKTKYYAIIASRAAYYQSFSSYLPKVTVSDTIGGNTYLHATLYEDSQNFENTVGVSASWLIFDSLVREMNVAAAKHGWRQSEALELDARRLLIRSVAYAYNDILLSKAKIRIAKEDMKFQNSQLKENELKFEVGAVPLSNVLNFKAYYNSAESSLYAAEYSYNMAKYVLAKLMGLTESTIPDDVKFPEALSSDGETLLSLNVYLDTALANRPDLKAYREALEVSKYNYWASICSFGPTVTFDMSLSYTSGEERFTSDDSQTVHRSISSAPLSYGFTASWEIFSGGKTFYNMRAKQAAMMQTDYTLAYQWISVLTEVRTAYDNYQTCVKQAKISQMSLELYRKIRDLVAEEYQAGNTELTRLNEAQKDFVNAESSFATYVINMHNAKAQLEAAIGSL